MPEAHDWEEVSCAFCGGMGTDPYDLLSSRSRCEVCKGRKRVRVPTPHDPCTFCQGTGSFKTFSCPVCHGKGVVHSLSGPSKLCPDCGGRAYESSSGLECLACHGRGRVVAEASQERRRS